MVVANMQANLETAKNILRYALPAMEALEDGCGCGSALAGAIITAPERIPPAKKRELRLLIDKYVEC
jgi:5'-methylthioadenosine phosphorylase